MKDVAYTTGQVAKFCRVAPRTVSKWFDSGKLTGYRLPGSQDRRVMRSVLIAFMREWGFSPDLLHGGVGGGGRVLAVGLGETLEDALDGVSAAGGPLHVSRVDDLFDAGMMLGAHRSDVLVVDRLLVGTGFPDRVRRLSGLGDLVLVAVLPADTADSELADAEGDGYDAVVRRTDVSQLVSLVSGWRKLEGGHRKPKAGVRAEKAGRRSTAAV